MRRRADGAGRSQQGPLGARPERKKKEREARQAKERGAARKAAKKK